jgi:glycosyltransferase involved in cell wall biosynthesis
MNYCIHFVFGIKIEIVMAQKVLFISYDGMTDPLGQSQVLPYLAGLVKKGYDVTILSCEKPERSSFINTVKTICTLHHLNWIPIQYTKKPPILSTIKDIKALKRKAKELHQEMSFDLVHCRSYIAAEVGLWMLQKLNVPYIFDMRGFWADERVDGGLWNRKNPLYNFIYKYYKKKEQRFLETAAAVVSLTHAAKDTIESWNYTHAPISVIPCCVDTVLFDPESLQHQQMSIVKRKADLPSNKLVLGYVGSLGTWYLLDEMMSFFAYWLKVIPESVFFFVTNEPSEMILKSAQKHMVDLEKIKVVTASRTEMPYMISLMDFGLFFIKNSFSKKASSPVKQGELMAMGVPVICNAGVGDSDFIVSQYKSGELVHGFDETYYAEAIARLQQSVTHPTIIRKSAMDYFDLEKGIQQYQNVYQEVLGNALDDSNS